MDANNDRQAIEFIFSLLLLCSQKLDSIHLIEAGQIDADLAQALMCAIGAKDALGRAIDQFDQANKRILDFSPDDVAISVLKSTVQIIGRNKTCEILSQVRPGPVATIDFIGEEPTMQIRS